MVSGFAVNRVRKVGLATSIIGFSLFASALAVMLKGRGVPPPVQFTLALLKNAETFPKEQIEPGTFKITLSPKALEEKSKFFKRSLVVAYHRSYGDNIAVVEFWLPREDGIFYYATEKLMTDWPRGFVIE
ncbi:MAG: hypothetical protein HYT34_02565, partial [Candidatus Ryanbacteria bacterium]|nr:hypothetical protein [Candidatus Ryanbacteria bacterium]